MVNDIALLLLWHTFDPWPENFYMLQAQSRKEKYHLPMVINKQFLKWHFYVFYSTTTFHLVVTRVSLLDSSFITGYKCWLSNSIISLIFVIKLKYGTSFMVPLLLWLLLLPTVCILWALGLFIFSVWIAFCYLTSHMSLQLFFYWPLLMTRSLICYKYF